MPSDRLTVFIIDDDASVRDALSLRLGIEGYRTALFADAEAFLAARRSDLSGASAEEIEAYFASLGARGLAPATAARRRAAVRQFYRFVLGERWRDDDPSRRVDAPKRGRPLPKVLTRAEIDALIAAASAREDEAAASRLACMIELIYASGLRISELTALTQASVARDPAYLIVRGKGGKERLAPLNGAARLAIKAYLEVRPAFLPAATKTTLGCFHRAEGRGASRRAASRSCSTRPPAPPASMRKRSARMCCAMRSQPTWSKAAPTCAWCRPSWATPT